jgi:diaminopimelate epimerase
VARLLLDDGNGDRELRLATTAGLLRARRAGSAIAVEMAEPRLRWDEIPLASACDTLQLPLDVPGLHRPTAVNMGNPHAVFFTADLEAVDVETLGPALECHQLFPQRANIGFAQVLSPERIRLRVYERGAGLTLACGSGACAAMVAARRHGLVDGAATLILDGGELEIAWAGSGPVTMTGSTAAVFSGVLAPEFLDD